MTIDLWLAGDRQAGIPSEPWFSGEREAQ